MIKRCIDAGLPGPEFALTDGFVTTIRRPVTPQVVPQDGAQSGPSQDRAGTSEGISHGTGLRHFLGGRDSVRAEYTEYEFETFMRHMGHKPHW